MGWHPRGPAGAIGRMEKGKEETTMIHGRGEGSREKIAIRDGENEGMSMDEEEEKGTEEVLSDGKIEEIEVNREIKMTIEEDLGITLPTFTGKEGNTKRASIVEDDGTDGERYVEEETKGSD